MSANHVHISNPVTDLSTQCTYDVCLMTHLSINGNFTTTDIRAINQCHMYKGIFFISNICNHQGNHLRKSTSDNETPLILLHGFNGPRKHHK